MVYLLFIIGIFVVYKVILLTSGGIKCRSCGWTGSQEKWNESKCCPSCYSDHMIYKNLE